MITCWVSFEIAQRMNALDIATGEVSGWLRSSLLGMTIAAAEDGIGASSHSQRTCDGTKCDLHQAKSSAVG